MLKIDEVIVVEGKYDKMKLSQFLDATVIETSGFGVFNNASLKKLLADAADKRGLIIMTDSDAAGFQIRRYLRSFIDESRIKNVYVPAIYGKEKRKKVPSSAGLIGVEGLNEDIILKAMEDAGIDPVKGSDTCRDKFSTIDLYRLGLSGRTNSRKKLMALLKLMGLPEQLSTKETLEVLGLYMTKIEFADFCAEHSEELSAMD